MATTAPVHEAEDTGENADENQTSAPPAEAGNDDKATKMVWDGSYVPGPDGNITVSINFPASALDHQPFDPVKAILFLCEQAELKGYGDGDSVQATLGVERAKRRNKDTGEQEKNPSAGRPTGTINIVIHTPETLEVARQRGRAGMSDSDKKTVAAASALIKSALLGGKGEEIQEIMGRQTKGEIDGPTALAQIAALMTS